MLFESRTMKMNNSRSMISEIQAQETIRKRKERQAELAELHQEQASKARAIIEQINESADDDDLHYNLQ